MRNFNVTEIRKDFPFLNRTTIDGKPFAYLDNAATSQKPLQVVEAMNEFYKHDYANIHRSAYFLSEQATQKYESARRKVQTFLNAKNEKEIVFTGGATEAINLVAHSYGQNLEPGDEIIISLLEHHSNIVPWQMLRDQRGIVIKVIPMNQKGELDLGAYEKLLTNKTQLVSVTHVSNAIGTINPIKRMIEIAHAKNIPVLIDGAQAVAHFPIDVQTLDADFYVFSGHKLLGPTGIGVLYGQEKWLEKMPPYQGGGGMIESVSFEKTTYQETPYKFEAGTPNIVGAIGLGHAIDYLKEFNFEDIQSYEEQLFNYAKQQLKQIPPLQFIGDPKSSAPVISFVLDNVHAHDVGTILDHEGVAVRTGHHCAMPLMEYFQVAATTRISFAFYNTVEEVDRLVHGLWCVNRYFGGAEAKVGKTG